MDKLAFRQRKIEDNFKKDLLLLLKKYNAVLEVEREENNIEVECFIFSKKEPYTFFSLPKIIYEDTDI